MTYLRAGTDRSSSEPFTARQDLKSAIAEYNRASALGDAHDAAPGLARALIGQGEPAEAARVLQPFASASTSPGPLLEIIIAADETAHNFGAAETAARHLDQLGTSAYPDGVALFPSGPLSFGADRLRSLSATLISPGGLASGAGGSVQDLGFIPEYRDDPGVTGTQASCASWT